MKINKEHHPMSKSELNVKASIIKLGIDIHKREYVVVEQVDGLNAKIPQRFTPEGFLLWIHKLKEKSDQIVSCYEAGCFGYVLHRKLESMGVKNFVVRPRNWDEYGSRVKTDARDATELCSHLDRYLNGNKTALSVVRVPTEEEERKRSLSRQRETISKELKRLQNVGISNGRYYGVELKGSWWKQKRFAGLLDDLPEFLIRILEPLQRILLVLHRELKEATAREERTANRKLPVGLGALTASVLDREFGDYHRFNNRKEVASYTGLCPSEYSSGNSRFQGSINKHGNSRIRHNLIEATWRLFQFQHDYKPIVYWKDRISKEPFGARKKKKMTVAIARRFAIDWWRINTGQIAPEDVGLRVDYPVAYATRALREGRISKVYA